MAKRTAKDAGCWKALDLDKKQLAWVRPYVAGTGFCRNTDHIKRASGRHSAYESTAVPESDLTPPIDSGEEPTGPEATPHPLSAEKLPEKPPSRADTRPRSFAGVAGMGFELAGTTVAIAGIGYLADRYFGGERSFGFAIGGLIGFGLGMFRFILKALRQIEESNA